MLLEKDIMLPNGVLGTVHRLINIKLNSNQHTIEAQVGSWINMTSLLSDSAPIWNHFVQVPTGDIVNMVYSDLLATDTFAGSTLKPSAANPLDIQKQYTWNDLKFERSRREYGGFVWDGSTFDSDPQSQSRIQGGVQLALLAQQANQPFSINWTLKDNTVRTLNGSEMISVGQALAVHVQSLHEMARSLRQQLDSATTVEQAESIKWPV